MDLKENGDNMLCIVGIFNEIRDVPGDILEFGVAGGTSICFENLIKFLMIIEVIGYPKSLFMGLIL